MKSFFLFVLALNITMISCKSSSNAPSDAAATVPDSTVLKTAQAAFVYAMPLALMDITRKKVTNYESAIDDKGGPINQMVNFTRFPDADFKDVVRPNADTYYNTSFMDLSSDALVLEVPNTSGRYYLLPMMDAWTNIFHSPGKRTTGTEAQKYLITGPQWKGTVPDGVEEIKSPTNLVWMIGRL